MKISRTENLDLKNLVKINGKIELREFEGVNYFIQKAIKINLKIMPQIIKYLFYNNIS